MRLMPTLFLLSSYTLAQIIRSVYGDCIYYFKAERIRSRNDLLAIISLGSN